MGKQAFITDGAQEKNLVERMIRLYCRRKEGNPSLCPDCKALLQYTRTRLDKCKFGDKRPTCKQCPTHCYKPEMRKQIQQVMRFSGPRMIIYAPIETIRHLIKSHL